MQRSATGCAEPDDANLLLAARRHGVAGMPAAAPSTARMALTVPAKSSGLSPQAMAVQNKENVKRIEQKYKDTCGFHLYYTYIKKRPGKKCDRCYGRPERHVQPDGFVEWATANLKL